MGPQPVAYHPWNQAGGRLAGQVKMRVRYKKWATQWVDLLMLSQEELGEIIEGQDWEIFETIQGEAGQYTAALEKG